MNVNDKQNKNIEEIDDARDTLCIIQFIAIICVSINNTNSILEWILVAAWIVSFTIWMRLFIKSIIDVLREKRAEYKKTAEDITGD